MSVSMHIEHLQLAVCIYLWPHKMPLTTVPQELIEQHKLGA